MLFSLFAIAYRVFWTVNHVSYHETCCDLFQSNLMHLTSNNLDVLYTGKSTCAIGALVFVAYARKMFKETKQHILLFSIFFNHFE